MKRKQTYKINIKPEIAIIVTGKVFLRYRDDEEVTNAQKGDLLIYPENEQLNTTWQGFYEKTGFAGYFKLDVCDGKNWQPVLLNDIFPEKENHFTRTERSLDTLAICIPMLEKLTGLKLLRTYREHYAPASSAEE